MYELYIVLVCFFFCKKRTENERATGDWSSDVCSSDLGEGRGGGGGGMSFDRRGRAPLVYLGGGREASIFQASISSTPASWSQGRRDAFNCSCPVIRMRRLQLLPALVQIEDTKA